MKSIRSHADANAVAKKFIAEKLEIQLWDNFESSKVMCYIRKDEDRRPYYIHLVAFVDSVDGDIENSWVSESEIEEAIWHNRKFINQSGQLAYI